MSSAGKEVNASMGLMLEQTVALAVHDFAPSKEQVCEKLVDRRKHQMGAWWGTRGLQHREKLKLSRRGFSHGWMSLMAVDPTLDNPQPPTASYRQRGLASLLLALSPWDSGAVWSKKRGAQLYDQSSLPL